MSEPNSSQASSKPTTSPMGASTLSKIALGVALLALIGTSLSLIQAQRDLQDQKGIQKTFASLNDNQSEAITKLTKAVETLRSTSTDNQQGVTKINQALQKVLATKQEAHHTLRRANLFYKIQLADLQLRYTHDINAAKTLLASALDDLKALSDVRLQKAATLIQAHLTQLDKIPQDVQSDTLTKLEQLSEQVTNLKLAMHIASEKPKATVQTDDKTASLWQRAVTNTWRGLNQIVTVRRLEGHDSVLVSPLQQQVLLQRVILSLQQAQWAVLEHDQAKYDQYLQRAKTLVTQYFAADDPNTKTFNTTLKSLAKLNIAPPSPSLADVMAALSQPSQEASSQ